MRHTSPHPNLARALRWAALAVVATLVATGPLFAADVTVTVSERTVYVDVPFRLTVRVSGSDGAGRPALPPMDGLEVIGQPSVTTGYQSINGRSSSWTDLVYTVVARREGQLVVPAIEVVAGGDRFRSEPITIEAVPVTDSAPGDSAFVRVVAGRDRYYVGERVPLTLEIWLKAYVDRAFGRSLGAQQMWNQVAKRGSAWGPFVAALDGRVTVREAVEDGARYFVYELAAPFVAEQAGPLAFDDVRIRVGYPVALREERDFFGRREFSVEEEPLILAVGPTAFEIAVPPAAGRPGWYDGAVGQYDFEVTAEPREVGAGDPITLTMTVRDRTAGSAALDLVPAPPLDRVEALVRDFRLPDDPLGGLVSEDGGKVFTQTVRAVSAEVTEIPAIPFAFFDPVAEDYVTRWSEPIPVEVAAVERLDASEVVGAATGRPAVTELTEVVGGILANYTDPADLLPPPPRGGRASIIALLLVPPAFFLATLVGHRRVERRRRDPGLARRHGAARRARKHLAAAAAAPPAEHARLVASALGAYVADRLDLPPGTLTGAEIADRLAERGIDEDAIGDVRELMRDCESAHYGARAAGAADGLTERAVGCIRRLEAARWR